MNRKAILMFDGVIVLGVCLLVMKEGVNAITLVLTGVSGVGIMLAAKSIAWQRMTTYIINEWMIGLVKSSFNKKAVGEECELQIQLNELDTVYSREYLNTYCTPKFQKILGMMLSKGGTFDPNERVQVNGHRVNYNEVHMLVATSTRVYKLRLIKETKNPFVAWAYEWKLDNMCSKSITS